MGDEAGKPEELEPQGHEEGTAEGQETTQGACISLGCSGRSLHL